jgi:eukaryotic-like serine/threonine-protein kinase
MSAVPGAEQGEPRSTASSTVAIGKRRLAAVSVTIAALIIALATGTSLRIEQVVERQLAKVLVAPHHAAIEGLRLWVENAERAASAAALDAELSGLLAECIERRPCAAEAIALRLSAYVRAAGFTRYRLADLSGEVHALGPSRGSALPLDDTTRARVAELPPRARVLPPFLDAGRPIMLAAAPVHTKTGARIGTLLFDLPLAGLDRVLKAARAGHSVETYAFDDQGLLVSESRFLPDLRRSGLLPEHAESAVLRVEVRDPGGDLTRGFEPKLPRAEQPLTRMAERAIRGEHGVDVEGYRDYRGVPVVGAWRFLPELGLGVATEVDVAEAFATLHALRQVFAILVGALALAGCAALVAAALAGRLRSRAQHAERLAARFGQYRIERKLGQGGMGVVYLGSHDLLRRPAAIKLLRPDRVSEEAIERFEREVRITSTLTHPNTVAIYDYGRADDGTLYYVMEYLEGLDLQRLVARFGPLPPARVVHFLTQLCGSLAEAHGAGLVHRDIKPANLLACTRGGVADVLKVLDFGVVQIGARDPGVDDLIGTPEYMAPELFESSGQASPQTDLYAVGAIAYFLLTGSPPFEGASGAEQCQAHLTEQPEPPSVRLGATVDPMLEHAVLACLSKRRQARPSSAAGLRALLQRSPLVYAWTQADADAWWAARKVELETLRASLPPGLPTDVPSRRMLRPAAAE